MFAERQPRCPYPHECDWLRIAGIIVTQRCGNLCVPAFLPLSVTCASPLA